MKSTSVPTWRNTKTTWSWLTFYNTTPPKSQISLLGLILQKFSSSLFTRHVTTSWTSFESDYFNHKNHHHEGQLTLNFWQNATYLFSWDPCTKHWLDFPFIIVILPWSTASAERICGNICTQWLDICVCLNLPTPKVLDKEMPVTDTND